MIIVMFVITGSALEAAQRHEIDIMVLCAVFRIELIRTLWVLSTLVTYLIAVHLFIKEYLVSSMVVLKPFKRDVWNDVSVVNHAVHYVEIFVHVLSKCFVSDTGTTEIMNLDFTFDFLLDV